MEPPVRKKPGPPQGRVPKMLSHPLFLSGLALILIATILAGVFA